MNKKELIERGYEYVGRNIITGIEVWTNIITYPDSDTVIVLYYNPKDDCTITKDVFAYDHIYKFKMIAEKLENKRQIKNNWKKGE